MKPIKFFATVFVAASMLLLNACNSGDDKKTDTTTTDTTTVKNETPPPTTMPSGPQMMMVVMHKVANYDKWKPGYEMHDSARLANGLHNYVIARGVDDPNMVMVALKMDDVNKAKAIGSSADLKDAMKKAGVIGTPTINYLEAVMNDTTAISQTVRLLVKHKVKDWDAWKKSFDSHKQVRIDAGLTDRVIGYSVGDNHEVALVFAVADIAKAKAFSKSQDLKDKMAEAGVDGPPSFFYYNIVAKY